jgi:hypothetical protein
LRKGGFAIAAFIWLIPDRRIEKQLARQKPNNLAEDGAR